MDTNPESNPPATGWHGLPKSDWVTLWFPGLEHMVNNRQSDERLRVQNLRDAEVKHDYRAFSCIGQRVG